MKKRLDVLLVERGLAESRAQAQALVLAGLVPGFDKAGTQVDENVELTVESPRPYVSRAGHKLANALDAFGLDVTGLDCCDVGASTGGFTDVLLQRGAARVIALDVGYGQLHPRLRDDPRVVVMERTNARHVTELPFAPQLVTCDVSFISVKLALPPILRLAAPGWQALVLVKPQFEAGRGETQKGVVRDPGVQRRVVREIVEAALGWGGETVGVVDSGLPGPKGNREFVLSLSSVRSRALPTTSTAESTQPSRQPIRRATVVPHGKPETLGDAVERVRRVAAEAGVELTDDAPELAVVLGGDGTVLRALQRFLGKGVPVIGVNFGRVGFLCSMTPAGLEDGLRRAFAGDYVTVELPTLEVRCGGEEATAVNDVVATSATLGRMVELEWRIGGEEMGHVPCDGAICSTPSGSTAYNLSNGGPVLMWGLDALTVTFVAPHSFDVRPVVVPRSREVELRNITPDVALAVIVDGHRTADLERGGMIEVTLGDRQSLLATLPDATFVTRYRKTFT